MQGLGLGVRDSHWAGAYSSQEELRAKHDEILVSTTTTHVQDSVDDIHLQCPNSIHTIVTLCCFADLCLHVHSTRDELTLHGRLLNEG